MVCFKKGGLGGVSVCFLLSVLVSVQEAKLCFRRKIVPLSLGKKIIRTCSTLVTLALTC